MKEKPKNSEDGLHKFALKEYGPLFKTQEEALNYACFYYGTTTTTEVYRDGKFWYAAIPPSPSWP